MASVGFGGAPARRVLRFGEKIRGDDVPTMPLRYSGPFGPSGKLVGVRLRPSTGEVWLRVERHAAGSRLPWKHEIATLAANGAQPPAPTPDSLELRRAMRVYCEEGYIGRMEGITLDPREGVAMELLVQIRGDVLAEVDGPRSPMAPLVPVAGQHVLISPAWAHAVKPEEDTLPFSGPDVALYLEATAEQVAAGARLRRDQDVAADIVAILSANPAVAPHTAALDVEVHDGDVTIRGALPTPRHRASMEQDVWHVPGVFALHDEVRVTG